MHWTATKEFTTPDVWLRSATRLNRMQPLEVATSSTPSDMQISSQFLSGHT
jgi:hypothetical protein